LENKYDADDDDDDEVGLGLGLGVGLVASLLLIAGCRFTIPRGRGPVTGSRYTTLFINVMWPPQAGLVSGYSRYYTKPKTKTKTKSKPRGNELKYTEWGNVEI